MNSVFSRWLTSLGTISINAVMQAAGLLVFARKLGPSEYAVIVAALAVAAVATEFVGFGAGDLLIREVSRNPTAHRSAFGRAIRLVAISFLPAALLASIVAVLWFRSGAPFWVVIVLVASEIATGRILFMTEQVAIAHHQTHRANLNRIFATAVRFAIICLAVFAAGVSTASDWAPFAALSAILCCSGCLAITARHFGSPDLSAPWGSDFHIGVMFTLMQIVRAAQFSVDKFAVGWIAPGSTVGTFGIASRISQLGMLPATAITRITYPIFFAEGAKGLIPAIGYARRILPAIAAVAVLSSAGLVLVAFVLPYLLGPKFAAAEYFLLILAALPLAAGLQNLAGDVLSGSDFQLFRLIAGLSGFGLTLAATAAGGFMYGLPGALVGYVIGQFLLAASNWVTVWYLRHWVKRAPQTAG